MNKYYIFIGLSLIIFNLQAKLTPEAQHVVDSLYHEIKTSKYDTTIANAYVSLSEYLYIINIDTLLPTCTKAKEICQKNLKRKDLTANELYSFKYILSAAYNNIGFVYGQRGDQVKEMDYFKKSLKIKYQIKDQKSIAISLNNIGACYKKQGDLTKAIEYYSKSLKIKEKLGEERGVSLTLANIGVIYESQNEIDKALEYYEKALKIQEKIQDERLIAVSLNNIALVHFLKHNYDLSLDYNLKSLALREKIGDELGIGNSYHNIGLVYKEQGKLNDALDYYRKSLSIKEKLGDVHSIPPTLSNIGFIYYELCNYSKAKEFGKKSLAIAQKQKNPKNIENASHLLHKVYEKLKLYKEAFQMSELYHEMRDSTQNETIRKAALKQNMQYEYDKKAAADSIAFEKEKQITEAEIAKQKAEIKAKRNQQYALYGGLTLVLIFSGFIFNRFRVTQKQKQVIEDQKYLVEEKNKEITDSIHYAKRIQAAILPPTKLVKEYLKESFILYKPKDIVAGDFYWMEHKDNVVLFAAADCTGHGVPGAMVSVVCNNGLNRSVREHGLTEPGEILSKTREIVISEFEKSEDEVKDGMDIALCSLSHNKKQEIILKYAGANNPLWIIRNGEILETKANKQPIGKFDELIPYTTHTFTLLKDDTIYIFSDGYVDQFGGDKGKKFKVQAFRNLLLNIQDKKMEEQKEIIDTTFENWKGNLEQIDDVCVIGVRV